MAKSPDAFRTISEVADWLGIQAHVLRFWESKFTQVKPIKRAGGRRYYRPADMLLLGGIKKLLHDDGLTIKGVQKILREEGMSHVVDLSAPLDDLTLSQLGDAEPPTPKTKPSTAVVTPEEEKGVVLSFDGNSGSKPDDVAPQDTEIKEEPIRLDEEITTADAPSTEPPKADPDPRPEPTVQADALHDDEAAAPETPHPEDDQTQASDPELQDAAPDAPAPKDEEEPVPVAALPAFLRHPLADQDTRAEKPQVPTKPDAETAAAPPQAAVPEPTAPAPKKPRVIDPPVFTAEADFPAAPAVLTAAFRARKIAPEHAAKAGILLRQLTALRDSMAARRRNAAPPPSQD